MLAQVIAVTIFVVMFALIITDKIERHYVTLGCGLVTLIGVFGIGMRDLAATWKTLNIAPIFTPGIMQELRRKVQVVLIGRPLYSLQE